MRKEQKKILEKAKKHKMSTEQIAMLSREDITISGLNIIYWYFRGKEDISADMLVPEAERCLDMISEIPGNVPANEKKVLTEMLLQPYIKDDELLGSPKKARIIKMYRHYIQSGKKSIGFLYDYTNMLYHGFSAWHIGVILKNSDNTLDGCWNTLGRLKRNEFLMDDFINNGKDSMYYYITKCTDIAVKCRQIEFSQIKKFYDMDTHRYSVPTTDFPKMFTYVADREEYIVNDDYFTRLVLSSSPVLSIVHTFCTSGRMKTDIIYSSISGIWSMKALVNPEREEDLQKCIKIMDKGFTVNFPSYYMRISISDTGFINVTYEEYSRINVSTSEQALWYQNRATFIRNFMISPDGKLFRKLSGIKTRYYPMQVKDFICLYKRQNVCGELMSEILAYYKGKNIFYNDVINDMLATGCMMSLPFNEILDYHNRADLITKKYKTSAGLRIKWNKQNLNLSYMIMKSLTYVCPGKSREILLQQKDIFLLNKIPEYGKASQKCMVFIEQVLYKNIINGEKRRLTPAKRAKIEEKYRNEIKEEINTDVLPDEYQTWINERVEKEISLDGINHTVHDYVNMCHTTKNKIRLDVYSAAQMYNLHDRITNSPDDYRKMTGEVNIPKNSVFNELREILPPEFEWIKTRKRLILETELQHHCVWSYAKKISNDKCAIYSYTDTNADHCPDGVPKRYTIEFCRNNGKYYVNQVQGKYDRVNADNMREYIEEILRECEKKKMRK